MKALYIHGFQSTPVKTKIDILKKYFDGVIAPLIDWEDKEDRVNLFQDLSKIIEKQGITHIIGSSMGGQMAFFLSTYLNKNGLCFNPAFGHVYNDFEFRINKDFTGKILIDLGKSDDIVSPAETVKFIQNSVFNDDDIYIEYLNIGHTIDTDTFENAVIKLISL